MVSGCIHVLVSRALRRENLLTRVALPPGSPTRDVALHLVVCDESDTFVKRPEAPAFQYLSHYAETVRVWSKSGVPASDKVPMLKVPWLGEKTPKVEMTQ
eukprot:1851552-Rhodomonas_salina.1